MRWKSKRGTQPPSLLHLPDKPEQGSGRMCIRRLAANLLHLPASWRGVEEAIQSTASLPRGSFGFSLYGPPPPSFLVRRFLAGLSGRSHEGTQNYSRMGEMQ